MKKELLVNVVLILLVLGLGVVYLAEDPLYLSPAKSGVNSCEQAAEFIESNLDNERGFVSQREFRQGKRSLEACISRQDASIVLDKYLRNVASEELECLVELSADLDGNNAVDIFDLLFLLSNWNSDGPGADIAEPLDVVDIFDLIGLLNEWSREVCQCADGVDNDFDGFIDWPSDLGCDSALDDEELGGGVVGDFVLTASRVSGVAPLSVHFDSIEGKTWGEYSDMDYEWDFEGDGNSDFNGFLAAHVYEEEGEYTARLTVRDQQGAIIDNDFIDISVESADDFYSGQSTACVRQNSNGNFAGCPSGAKQVTAPTGAHIKNEIASNKRVLLRRGDSWDGFHLVSTSDKVNLQIGDFGSASDDKPELTGSADTFGFYESENVSIFNIKFVGAAGNSIFADMAASSENLLFSGLSVQDFGYGFLGPSGGSSLNTLIKDTEIDLIQEYAIFPEFSVNFALLNTNITRASIRANHAFRICNGEKGLLNNVRFENNFGTNLQIRATSAVATRDWLVSDSYFGPAPTGDEALKLQVCAGPINPIHKVHNVVFERNVIEGQLIQNQVGSNLLIRNNLILHGRGVTNSGSGGVRNVKIYNNVQYDDQPPSGSHFVNIGDEVIGVDVRNNIYSANVFLGNWGGNPEIDENNLRESEINFVNSGDPLNGGLALASGSNGIDSGSQVLARDFLRNLRPLGQGIDVGAYEVL